MYSIELIPELARSAGERLARLGYGQVQVKSGDGYQGWPEFAPFDAILVTAAAPEIPAALKDQLKEGGRLIIPVGPTFGPQYLLRLTKQGNAFQEERLIPVAFVPLVKPKQSDKKGVENTQNLGANLPSPPILENTGQPLIHRNLIFDCAKSPFFDALHLHDVFNLFIGPVVDDGLSFYRADFRQGLQHVLAGRVEVDLLAGGQLGGGGRLGSEGPLPWLALELRRVAGADSRSRSWPVSRAAWTWAGLQIPSPAASSAAMFLAVSPVLARSSTEVYGRPAIIFLAVDLPIPGRDSSSAGKPCSGRLIWSALQP